MQVSLRGEKAPEVNWSNIYFPHYKRLIFFLKKIYLILSTQLISNIIYDSGNLRLYYNHKYLSLEIHSFKKTGILGSVWNYWFSGLGKNLRRLGISQPGITNSTSQTGCFFRMIKVEAREDIPSSHPCLVLCSRCCFF